MLRPGVRPRVTIGRLGLGEAQSKRPVPLEYAEAVETWAREHGGHAKLRWLPTPMNCWAVVLSFKLGDPRQGGPEDGEPVLLHEWWTAKQWQQRKPRMARRHHRTNQIMPGNYAFELDELGVDGLRKWLDRGNILSGRGEFQSVEHAGQVQQEQHEKLNESRYRAAKSNARDLAKDVRRQVLKIPFIGVGIEFGRAASGASTTTKEQ